MSGSRARARRHQPGGLPAGVVVPAWCENEQRYVPGPFRIGPGTEEIYIYGTVSRCPFCQSPTEVEDGMYSYAGMILDEAARLGRGELRQVIADLRRLQQEPELVQQGFLERHPTVHRLLGAAEPKDLSDYYLLAKMIAFVVCLLWLVLNGGDPKDLPRDIVRSVVPKAPSESAPVVPAAPDAP